MPELVLHFSVPFALTAPVLGLRKAIFISLVSLLPDLDVLLHTHRSGSHSVIILGAISLMVVGLVSKLRPRLLILASAGCLALLGHPIMDMFSTYTPILYPLVKDSVYLNVEVRALIASSISPILEAEIRTRPTRFENFGRFDAPIFSNESFIVSVLLVAIPILLVLSQRLRVRSSTRDL